MALPATIDPSSPAGGESLGLGDNQIRDLKQLIVDLFNLVVSPTQITAAPFNISAAGLVTLAQIDTTLKNIIINQGTITALKAIIDATATWNNAAVTFKGISLNVTDTASNAASLLLDLLVSSVSKAKIDKTGKLTLAGDLVTNGITLLTASIADGQWLKRSGSSILGFTVTVSAAAPSGGSDGDFWFTHA